MSGSSSPGQARQNDRPALWRKSKACRAGPSRGCQRWHCVYIPSQNAPDCALEATRGACQKTSAKNRSPRASLSRRKSGVRSPYALSPTVGTCQAQSRDTNNARPLGYFVNRVRSYCYPPPSQTPAPACLPASTLAGQIEEYLLVCQIAGQSPRTVGNRRDRLGRLAWWTARSKCQSLDSEALRAFFLYLARSHADPSGRWGNPGARNPLSPGTLKSYYSTLRTFFLWLVAEEVIAASPLARVPVPIDRPDQIQPLTQEQARDLLRAACQTRQPLRDSAIILLLLDTGVRASEACGLALRSVSLSPSAPFVAVEGKGGRRRCCPISPITRRAIARYLRDCHRAQGLAEDPSRPLFLSERGEGRALNRQGLLVLIARLGERAGIRGVRCSPHTLRHTFAISFLRAGGNMFSLREILGHSSLAMTSRYVALAEADTARQHRLHSPLALLLSSGQ